MMILTTINITITIFFILVIKKVIDYRKSQLTLTRLFGHVNIGYYRFRYSDGIIVAANKGFTDILELDVLPKDVIGKHVDELFVTIDKKEKLIEKITTQEEIKNEEIWIKTNKNNKKCLGFNAYIIKDTVTRKGAVEAVFEDITEKESSYAEKLKEAKDHLEEKVIERTEELLNINQKMHRSERLAFLGKLAGSITHELRNPLAVLKNATFVFKRRFKDSKDEKVIKYIVTVERELEVINSIIDEILGFAKTKPVELEKADMKDVIGKTIAQIDMPEFVEVRNEVGTVPIIEIDISQVIHALTNIINNAIMAMNGNGVLTLRAKVDKNFLCLEITDTGPGIPEGQRELIFEPLYSSKPKGTGLGLPLAKMMIENQEGHIFFESQIGKGTTFKVFLPIKRSEEKDDNE